jgi:hypothetical protein
MVCIGACWWVGSALATREERPALARAKETGRTTNEDRWKVYPVTTFWFDRVKMYVGWDLADRARIAELHRSLDSDITGVVEGLGKQLTKFKGTQSLMSNARFVQRLYGVLREWLMGLLGGIFDEEYVENRLAFGRKLAEIDLTFEDVILLEELTRRQLFEFARERLRERPQVLSSTICTLDKAFNLDLALIYNVYLEVRDAEMERALLDRFLTVTGFSRTLYENLAEAQGWGGKSRQQTELS